MIDTSPLALRSDPAVSVVMSVYNGAAYLRESMDSILDQTLRDIEFIVVNDGSRDATETILQEYAARDPRVRVISRENRGLIASLNEGVAQARAPLLARMDADDISSSDRLQRQVAVMIERPDLLALGTWGQVISADGRLTGKQMHPPVGPAKIKEAFDSGLGFVVHPTLMMRRDAFHRVGGYRAAYKTAEDLDLMYRFAHLGTIDNLPEFHLHYRVHDANITIVHAYCQQMMGALIAELNSILLQEGIDLTGMPTMPPDLADLDRIFARPGLTQSVSLRMMHPYYVGSDAAVSDEGFGHTMATLGWMRRSPDPEIRRRVPDLRLRALKALARQKRWLHLFKFARAAYL